ncbi:hypothetical protein DLM76_07075 [Leptospira yasudae]|uniref:Uncharacterized protein n=1 Tax=Leptospira yasudae TaxID=2202201 RepID=A0ABX9M7X2_9LEPT|nr:hypothetical protein DLM77_01265 [Leptospira yasudae]RHX95079.1 hypothetical protein DLM76_07075 [Leptospira yasudae]
MILSYFEWEFQFIFDDFIFSISGKYFPDLRLFAKDLFYNPLYLVVDFIFLWKLGSSSLSFLCF